MMTIISVVKKGWKFNSNKIVAVPFKCKNYAVIYQYAKWDDVSFTSINELHVIYKYKHQNYTSRRFNCKENDLYKTKESTIKGS